MGGLLKPTDPTTRFGDGRMAGGFFKAEGVTASQPLVVIRIDDSEAGLSTAEQAGGRITKPIVSYPGGRRFHFTAPMGNELAAGAA